MHPQSLAECPYPGLRRFDASNAHLYFGRERETQTLVDRLRRSRFLAVTGESGCGKSSLIRAGVIPALLAGPAEWRIAIMQPGDDPIGCLARCLTETLAANEPDQPAEVASEILEAALRSSSRGIDHALTQNKFPVGVNLLILVDQFEEVFRFKNRGADEDARAFVRLLLTATSGTDRRVHAILTMRSDFLGDCAQFDGLPEAINRGEFLVSRMTRDELRSAVVEPAAVAQTGVAPRLVARVLNEIGDNPGELPVLQHALMRTWYAWSNDHGEGEPMDNRHYEAIGTLANALSLHADETLAQLGQSGLQPAAGKMFRSLTDMPLGGRPVRRPTAFGVLCRIAAVSAGDMEKVVRHFAAPGRDFLACPADPANPIPESAVIDLTHESLITRWRTLRGWVADEVRDVDLYRALARDAALHQKNQRSLWRNPELAVARRWRAERRPNREWAEQYAPGFDTALAFLDASEQHYRRQQFVRRGLVTGGIGIVVLAIALFAWAQRAEARMQTANAAAEKLRADAAVSEKDRLARRIGELTAQNPQLGEEAVRLRKTNRELEWNILQLQQQSSRTEQQISSLRQDNQDLEGRLKQIVDDRASIQQLIAKKEQAFAALKQDQLRLEQDQKAKQATWEALSEANRKLREAALQAGIMPMAVLGVVGGVAGSLRPGETDNLTAFRPLPRQTVPDTAELDRLKFQVQQLERENLALKQSVEELREHNQRLTAQHAQETQRALALKSERDKQQARNSDLHAALQNAQTEVSQLLSALRQRDNEYSTLNSQVAGLRWQIQQLDEAIATVEHENDAIGRALTRK